MSLSTKDLIKRFKQMGMSQDEILEALDELSKEKDLTDKILDNIDKNKELYPTKDNGFFFEKKPDYDGLANYLISEHHLKCDDSLVYVWSGKHYKSISFLNLKQRIDKIVKPNTSPSHIYNFYQKALIKSYIDIHEIKEVNGLLNCNNGVYNLKTKTLTDHNPNIFIKYVLEHDYNRDAKCPVFMRALDLVTDSNAELKRLIQQIFGYCIVGGHPKTHEAFMFYGEGSNGKSTIITALSNLIGDENTARVPIEMLDKPFSVISLDGKLVNLVDETPKFNINAEAFKKATAGGHLRAAHKGKPEFDLKINARFIFACNKMPNFKDDSNGLLRRLIIVPFNHEIKQQDKDLDIDNKIKKEMSGILNWAIDGLNDLIKANFKFNVSKVNHDAIESYREETDSAYLFLKEYMIFQDNLLHGEANYVESKDVYNAYKLFCSTDGYFAISKRQFEIKAVKYYKNIYAQHNLVLNPEKDRQKFGRQKGIKRFLLTFDS